MVDIKFAEYQRLKNAGKFSKDILNTLMNTTKKPIMAPKDWYDLFRGDSARSLEQVIGKIEINGKKVNLTEATNVSLSNKVRYTFAQETSTGATIRCGSYTPPFQMANVSKPIKLPNKPEPPKYQAPRRTPVKIEEPKVEERIPDYNPDPNYFTCGSVKKVKRGFFAPAKVEFYDKKNVFTANDDLVNIALHKARGRKLQVEIRYKGKIIVNDGGRLCGLSDFSYGYKVNGLIKYGGYGKYDVDIKLDGRLKKSLEFYIIR